MPLTLEFTGGVAGESGQGDIGRWGGKAAVLAGRHSQKSAHYRVAKTHRIPYLYRSFSAKEPYI